MQLHMKKETLCLLKLTRSKELFMQIFEIVVLLQYMDMILVTEEFPA